MTSHNCCLNQVQALANLSHEATAETSEAYDGSNVAADLARPSDQAATGIDRFIT
jgi:hypothetical protein